MKVKHIKIKDLNENQQIQLVISTADKHRTTTVYSKIKKIKHVLAAEVETISN